MDQDFANNEIYKYLTEKKCSNLVSIINTTYDNCEYILGEIPKEFSNYTIHDIHHAIHVINYMTDFIKPNINKFSDFHLALILLVGLLHDTGMFVSDEEKEEILSKIITKENTDKQKDIFQDYIRELHSKRVRNVLDNYVIDKATGSIFSSIFRLDSYNFTDDIALICQSHTEELDWIKENLSASKIITKYSYNPQHIALLLKLGDNLDIDARRAPYSLLKLLEIKGYSETEWEKHSPIKNYEKVKYANNLFQIYFFGDCDNAFIYRKVMDHILWLQNTCSAIKSIASKYDEPYRFNIDEKIDNKIEPKGFEATNLHFSLDYSSVLKLLMGEQIYGEKKAGLRELLQNSIDAIMVMREELSNKATSNYQPTIWIEMNSKNNTISVCDNGIGMSDSVLRKFFFNIGKSYYVSNDYKKLNLSYSAIGHFGIGFLACFMLSSNVLMETQTAGQKPIVIEFEKMSQYVTKLKNPSCSFEEGHGTRIHLSYNEIIPHIFESENALIAYVRNVILIDGYKLHVINSENKVFDINPLDNSNIRHVSTEKLDLDYSITRPLTFWSELSDVWPSCHSLLLCCHDYDLGYETKYPIIVDLLEVFRIVDDLYQERCDVKSMNDLLRVPGSIRCKSRSTRIFLIHMLENVDDLSELKTYIKQFAFRKTFNGTSFNYSFLPYSLTESRTLVGRKKAHTAIIGLGKSDLKLLREKTNDNTIMSDYDSIYDEFIGINAKALRRQSVRVLKADGEDVYLPIDSNVYVFNALIYMHGILVKSANIRLSMANLYMGNVFKPLLVNVKSDAYELNISRNEFNNDSKDELNYEITKEIYLDIINNPEGEFSSAEKQLLIKLYGLIAKNK